MLHQPDNTSGLETRGVEFYFFVQQNDARELCITPNFQIKAAHHNPVIVGVEVSRFAAERYAGLAE